MHARTLARPHALPHLGQVCPQRGAQGGAAPRQARSHHAVQMGVLHRADEARGGGGGRERERDVKASTPLVLSTSGVLGMSGTRGWRTVLVEHVEPRARAYLQP